MEKVDPRNHDCIIESYKATVAGLTEIKKLNQDILEKWTLGISTAGFGFSINLIKQPDLIFTEGLIAPWLAFAIAIWASLTSSHVGVTLADKELHHWAEQLKLYDKQEKDPFESPPDTSKLKDKLIFLNKVTRYAVLAGAVTLIVFGFVNTIN